MQFSSLYFFRAQNHQSLKFSRSLAVCVSKYFHVLDPGEFKGGGGGVRRSFSLRDSTPSRTKGSPSVLLYDIHFRPTNLGRAIHFMTPIYTYYEGERARRKNRNFFSQHFSKCPKTAFLTCFFFSKICQGHKFFLVKIEHL